MGMGKFALSTKEGSQVRISDKHGAAVGCGMDATGSLGDAKTEKSPLVLPEHLLLGQSLESF